MVSHPVHPDLISTTDLVGIFLLDTFKAVIHQYSAFPLHSHRCFGYIPCI